MRQAPKISRIAAPTQRKHDTAIFVAVQSTAAKRKPSKRKGTGGRVIANRQQISDDFLKKRRLDREPQPADATPSVTSSKSLDVLAYEESQGCS
jgi:hypothetical protein